MKRYSNPSTVSQEDHRSQSQQLARTHGKTIQRTLGIITEVHKSRSLIKVRAVDGRDMSAGEFMPVSNSPQDISLRFGILRPGLQVIVTFAGEVEKNPIAEVVGFENEDIGDGLLLPNDIEKGLYIIFPPGSIPF